MFNNLAAEIRRTGKTNKEFAEKVQINPVTFSKKLNGKVDFTLSEVKKITEFFNCSFTIEYLFEENGAA
mgnify:CR=1 FL=1